MVETHLYIYITVTEQITAAKKKKIKKKLEHLIKLHIDQNF